MKSSKEAAELILKELDFPEHTIDKVRRIINEHSTEDIKEKSCIESRILFDADKIDGLGEIGIARVFLLCGQRGMTIKEGIEWYRSKIVIALENIQTGEGRKMAEDRLKTTQDFLGKLEKLLQ